MSDRAAERDGVARAGAKTLAVADLEVGMILEEELRDGSRELLAPKWTAMTVSILRRLRRLAEDRSAAAGRREPEPISDRLRFLAVDGEATARSALAEHLSSLGDCDEAADGKEALAAIRRRLIERHRPYDLICLNSQTPGIDGLGLLRLIRRLERAMGGRLGHRMKIIMTMAAPDHQLVMRAFVEGCDACLEKPVHREQLLAHMRLMGLLK